MADIKDFVWVKETDPSCRVLIGRDGPGTGMFCGGRIHEGEQVCRGHKAEWTELKEVKR